MAEKQAEMTMGGVKISFLRKKNKKKNKIAVLVTESKCP